MRACVWRCAYANRKHLCWMHRNANILFAQKLQCKKINQMLYKARWNGNIVKAGKKTSCLTESHIPFEKNSRWINDVINNGQIGKFMRWEDYKYRCRKLYLKYIGGVDIRGKSGSCELQAANALLPQIICIRINAIKSNRME